MIEFHLALILFSALILLLSIERIVCRKRILKIPLRICVTGTRGKSSVVRLIVSILREAGYIVIGKTTGSEPNIILPDGREIIQRRIGPVSILEQKKLIRLAARKKAQILVSEIMSISPECQTVESGKLLNPNICVITNVELDHTAQLGDTTHDVAESLMHSFPKRGTIFCLENPHIGDFARKAQKLHSELVIGSPSLPGRYQQAIENLHYYEFNENVLLATMVGRHLKSKEEQILQGIKKVRADLGALQAWLYQKGNTKLFTVNAFAANDPQSTNKVIDVLLNRFCSTSERFIGLLNLRADRGDRTAQWIRAFRSRGFDPFSRLIVLGTHPHAAVVRRVLRRCSCPSCWLKHAAPERIMEKILALENEGAVVIGIGNIGGLGTKLVHYWKSTGTQYEL